MADHKVYRDAINGEYVTPEYAAEHPDTTVSETVPDTEAPATD
jgi:hypothetical protein